jgi:hypothetical protein
LAERIGDALCHQAPASVVFIDKQDAPGVAARVLLVFPRDHVERLLADVLGLIGHALEAAGNRHERGQRLERDFVFLPELEKFSIDDALETIGFLFHRAEAAGQVGILREIRLHRVPEHGDGQTGDLPVTVERKRAVEIAYLEDLPRDALGVIAHALDFLVDLDRDVSKAEMLRHRLLAHDEFEAKPVDLLLQRVNALVAQDDRVGHLPVALDQAAQAGVECACRQPRHLVYLASDAIQVALQGLFVVGWHIVDAT